MNLKSAARRLGVHYQTAYRYVRSGDLVAVRIGAGYEISEAAIEMLAARLEARGAAVPHARQSVPAEPLTINAELDTLVQSCTLTAQPVFDLVTRQLATTIGDSCLLQMFGTDGVYVQPLSSFDAHPERRAIVDAFMSTTLRRVDESYGRTPVVVGRTAVQHHVQLEDAIRFLPPRFKEHVDRLVVQSYVAAPLKSPSGLVRGVLTVTRYAGGRPYTADEVATVEEMASIVATAIAQVERFSAAWVARDSLHESIQQLFVLKPAVELEEVSDLVLDLLDDRGAEAVFDTGGRVVAANDVFIERFGLEPSTLDSIRVGAGFATACPAGEGELLWSQLLSGARDFFSTRPGGCAVEPAGGPRIQWAVVRRPDATPAAIVAAGEPESPHPAADDPHAVQACWGLCVHGMPAASGERVTRIAVSGGPQGD